MRKVSLTIDPELLEQAKRLAPGGNLSAFVNEVLDAHIRREGLRQIVEEDEQRLGPVPEKVRQHVEREWRKLSEMPAF